MDSNESDGFEISNELGTTDIEVVGEWYHPESFQQIFRAAGRPLGGVVMRNALLIPEPKNPHDRNAVAVHIDDLLVGYVSAEEAPRIQRIALAYEKKGLRIAVLARVWARSEDDEWSARVTLSFSGATEEEWSYVDRPSWPGNRSPDGSERLTRAGERKQWHEADIAGRISGRDFDSFRPDIAQARADRDHHEALRLLAKCVDAAEKRAAVHFTRPAQWPTEQAAMVSRSLKDYDGEIRFIERFLDADPSGRGTKGLRERLLRACTLADRLDTTDTQLDAPAHLPDLSAPTTEVAVSTAAEVDLDPEAGDVIQDAYHEACVGIGETLETVAVLYEHMRKPGKFGGIAVYVNGRRVGYLGPYQVLSVRPLFADRVDSGGTLSVRGVMYATDEPKWSARIILGPYEQVAKRLGKSDPVPESLSAPTDPAEERGERIVLDAQRLIAEWRSAPEQRNRVVRGKDFVEWVEPIAQLRREGREDEALELLMECIEAAERDSRGRGWVPPSWYTEQAAIILRKRGDRAGEVSLLEGFIAACPPGQEHVVLKERLVKARARQRRNG
jgi:hypothetical protein